jgi:hypothetical protein
MAYTRTEWNNLQKRFPPEDRTSYEEYLAAITPAPAATKTAVPAAKPTPTTNLNPSTVIQKLTSGGTLTNEERAVIGMSPVSTPTTPTTPAAPAATKTAAPTSGIIPNFTPSVVMPTPAAQPGSSGFVGPVATPAAVKPTATWTKAGTVMTLQGSVDVDANGRAADGSIPISVTAPFIQSDSSTAWKKAGVVMTANGPVDVDVNGKAADGSTPVAATKDEKTKTFSWTDPDTGEIRTFNSPEELTAFVTSWSTNKTITANQAAKAEADRLKKEQENAFKRTAQEEFRAALTELGLADLADTVDSMIRDDFTAAQIKLELPKQPAYKLRFPGMQALRDAGQAINEATYISMERGYIQTLGAYGLDANVFGARNELGKYIANMVSPREFEERVNIAKNRVADNTDVVRQLKSYYPEVDNSAIVSYLLDPVKGIDIIKKQVRAAEIGAAATFAGFTDLGGKGQVGMGYAESLIGATGTADLAALKKDFGQAKTLSRTQSRLANIEGQAYDDTEAVSAMIAQEQSSMLASQRRAERETKFRFGGTGGVGSTSLRSTTNQ